MFFFLAVRRSRLWPRSSPRLVLAAGRHGATTATPKAGQTTATTTTTTALRSRSCLTRVHLGKAALTWARLEEHGLCLPQEHPERPWLGRPRWGRHCLPRLGRHGRDTLSSLRRRASIVAAQGTGRWTARRPVYVSFPFFFFFWEGLCLAKWSAGARVEGEAVLSVRTVGTQAHRLPRGLLLSVRRGGPPCARVRDRRQALCAARVQAVQGEGPLYQRMPAPTEMK